MGSMELSLEQALNALNVQGKDRAIIANQEHLPVLHPDNQVRVGRHGPVDGKFVPRDVPVPPPDVSKRSNLVYDLPGCIR